MTFNRAKEIFKEYLNDSGYNEKTIRNYFVYLANFFTYLKEETKITDIRSISETHIRSFLLWLESHVSKRTKKYLSMRTKNIVFLVVRMFFKSLYIKEAILVNPVLSIKYKPEGEIREKVILTEEEINLLLDSIDGKDFLSRRDRTLFELIYSSGLRAGEAGNLKLSDINFDESLIHIKLGKFGKDRIVPISETAMLFLKRFTKRMKGDSYIFYNLSTKNKLRVSAINKRLQKYLKDAEIKKKGVSTHSIRHSTASHLLDQGADLRYVQSLLGHESIETTVIYTHLLGEKMKRIYRSHHPRENTFYDEIDSAYMKELSELEKSILKLKRIKRRKSGLNNDVVVY